MGLLSEKVDLNSWPPGFSPLQANAFYIYQRNQIFIPLGILQSPFFNIEQPKALNYGLLGSIIGHEVRTFDKKFFLKFRLLIYNHEVFFLEHNKNFYIYSN